MSPITKSPTLMFIVATAMASTIATFASTILLSAHAEPVAPTAECQRASETAQPIVVPVPTPVASLEHETARARTPRVRRNELEVKGALDKEIIRRVVRAHINEVRHCYNQGLVRDADLHGRVVIQYTIGPTGRVPVSVVHSSDLSDRSVGHCIAKAAKEWKFPRPKGGGNVVVTYPFVLEPG